MLEGFQIQRQVRGGLERLEGPEELFRLYMKEEGTAGSYYMFPHSKE